MLKIKLFISAIIAAICFSNCGNFERDIDLELPEVAKELVVECYLVPGEPYRLLLTETKSYFEDLNACPIIKGATVIIKHNGVNDTLQEAVYLEDDCRLDNFFGILPFFNADRSRFYNYGSTRICPEDYVNDFELEVIDPNGGRSVSAVTRMLPPVEIDSMRSTFNEEDKAYALFFLQDDPAQVNFYRILLHETTLTIEDSIPFISIAKDPEFDVSLDDARFFNGETVSWGTNYSYEEDDTLISTVYHIDRAYHDYLETVADAQASNGNPFAQPGQIITNIQGGMGIFTFLTYDRDTLIVKR
ncbi:MAG: DUF4249 domain-containing protein [Saprospiraceae bacterium]|nr:DUF4249 domain-containing protein [Saprospiraceae bacterium]